ncbi:MAG: hypothetical protein COW00_13325 [Bdellovibrio sp. CG12_big_fil_rev_8_21_14_0_65_39_13]|nr:MAG: hypothetical protein COW78_11375 [Bdellovibrio sp. CG22_combo_CG10-13_8_21_14_all_39_27]PIQ58911.1 MAG: hypothetical protein COW00_13325 [Bdellovibrio sp. CG12_big_fil_rev_8_21_14_0_65_39_13]PIR36002.1 MAG: hypothetical protein COV37_05700 [Bdellovibrio sp. CG11_big_fil_rev_8_21_14_0_20_39_38]PJB53439.1 MAG: hypothetical protein CO099_07165 [Bdellovibrio sp. CG_4_9_14_3_um_filter_39_7]
MKLKVALLLLSFLAIPVAKADLVKAEKIYFSKNTKFRNILVAQELYKSKAFYSAAIFAKEHLVTDKVMTPELEDMLETLILKTGTLSFFTLSDEILDQKDSPSLRFILGLKSIHYERYNKAIAALKDFPKDHRFTPEAYLMLGTAYNILGKHNESIQAYGSCIQLSSKIEKEAKVERLERYFGIIRESCVIHKARSLFRHKKYEEALAIYEEIPKTSYRWPYLLLEKAWTSYYLKDYNRTLGLLTTYKSPLLTSYFFPEAEVLSALSYFRLCLWDDTMVMVDQYYKVYKPQSDALKKFILKEKNSQTFFLKMMLSPIREQEHLNPYIRNLITQTRKKVKFSLDLINYKKAQNEFKQLSERKKRSAFVNLLTEELKGIVSWRTKHLNHYIKKEMFDFVNDIHRFSYEMFNIKLEVMSLKRDLLYSNEKLVADRSRGDYSNVNRKIDQHFYHFDGEFWGDELGDYSFGLKSNCERVESKEESLQGARR